MPPGPLQIVGHDNLYTFEVHLRPHPPAVGKLFKAVTTVRGADGKPVDGGDFTLDFTMPSHGHGMITEPVHTAAGPGTWVSEGLKLHMHGPWRLAVTYKKDASKDASKDTGHAIWHQPPGAPTGGSR